MNTRQELPPWEITSKDDPGDGIKMPGDGIKIPGDGIKMPGDGNKMPKIVFFPRKIPFFISHGGKVIDFHMLDTKTVADLNGELQKVTNCPSKFHFQ